MKKLYLLLLTVLILVSSCKTKQERARRLLEKANRLYPIEFMKDTLLRIDTIIIHDTTVLSKPDTILVETTIEKDKEGNLKPFKGKLLLDNSKAKVFGSLNSDGKLTIEVQTKPQTFHFTFKIPFKYQLITKRMYYKSPPEIVKVRGFIWWTGLVSLISIIALGLFKLYTNYGTRIFKR